MTLKEELKKLYEESETAKKRKFLDDVLPNRLREVAKKGYNCLTVPSAELSYNGLTILEIEQWCVDNGLKFYQENAIYGRYISVYWL